MNKARGWGYVFPLAAGACWGTTALLVKIGVSGLTTPMAGATVSLFFAMLPLALPAAKDFKSSIGGDRRAVGFLLISGLASAIAIISQFTALSLSPVVVVSPLISISPLVTLLCAHLFLQRLEKVTPRIILAVFLVVFGAILITTGQAPS